MHAHVHSHRTHVHTHKEHLTDFMDFSLGTQWITHF